MQSSQKTQLILYYHILVCVSKNSPLKCIFLIIFWHIVSRSYSRRWNSHSFFGVPINLLKMLFCFPSRQIEAFSRLLFWDEHLMSSSLPLAGAWIASLPANCRCNSASMTHDKPQSSPPPRLSERQLKEAGRRLYSFCHCLAVKILLPEAWQGLVKYTSWQIISLPQLDAVLSRNTLGTHAHFSIADKHALPESRYNKTFISAGGQTCDTSSSGKCAACSTSPRSEVLVSGVRQTVTCLFTPARTVLTLSH